MNDPAGADKGNLVVVLSSEASRQLGESLATQLLEKRLVACVSLLPVRSLYLWQGRLESSDEVKLLLKTSPERLDDLREALERLHSYQIPEWIELRGNGAGAYLDWLQQELSEGPLLRPVSGETSA